LSHSTKPFFCVGCFWDRVLQTISLGLALNHDPPISASWVARIIGVSHQHPAKGGSWFEASPGKKLARPHFQKQVKSGWFMPKSSHEGNIGRSQTGSGKKQEWLKWQSACPTRVVLQKKKKKKMYKWEVNLLHHKLV
jgi:hypothetical protein